MGNLASFDIPSFLPCVVAWQQDLPSASTNNSHHSLVQPTFPSVSLTDLFFTAPSVLEKLCTDFERSRIVCSSVPLVPQSMQCNIPTSPNLGHLNRTPSHKTVYTGTMLSLQYTISGIKNDELAEFKTFFSISENEFRDIVTDKRGLSIKYGLNLKYEMNNQ